MTPPRALRPAAGALRGVAAPLAALLALALALLAVWQLERARAGIVIEPLAVGSTPATLYRPAEPGTPPPLVVVAHGFAGSSRMMEAFSLTLARSGFAALAFDFRGHGRNPRPMTGEVAAIDGVTAGLVAETRAVIEAARGVEGVGPPVALLGHSMATDVIMRAAAAEGLGTVVAVSMYSETVTAEAPQRLLVISGAREGRLRDVALLAAALVEPDAREGETVGDGPVRRRAVAAPLVGHVGVLWSPLALREARDWIAEAAGRPPGGPVATTGPWIALLLGAVLLIGWPLARLLPARPEAGALLGARRLAVLALGPAVLAAALAALVPVEAAGLRGAGGLAAFLFALGAGQAALLWRWGAPLGRPDALASAALILWSALFALALDRYGASFAVTGPRWGLMALLLPGAVLLAAADGAATRGAGLLATAAFRLVPILALLAAMIAAPDRLGLQFTALPVLALFWLVFGTMAGRIAARRGPGAPRAALGLVLAASLAGSLPLFG